MGHEEAAYYSLAVSAVLLIAVVPLLTVLSRLSTRLHQLIETDHVHRPEFVSATSAAQVLAERVTKIEERQIATLDRLDRLERLLTNRMPPSHDR